MYCWCSLKNNSNREIWMVEERGRGFWVILVSFFLAMILSVVTFPNSLPWEFGPMGVLSSSHSRVEKSTGQPRAKGLCSASGLQFFRGWFLGFRPSFVCGLCNRTRLDRPLSALDVELRLPRRFWGDDRELQRLGWPSLFCLSGRWRLGRPRSRFSLA